MTCHTRSHMHVEPQETADTNVRQECGRTKEAANEDVTGSERVEGGGTATGESEVDGRGGGGISDETQSEGRRQARRERNQSKRREEGFEDFNRGGVH